MATETAVAEILQESGCDQRGCDVRIWVEDNRVHASHEGTSVNGAHPPDAWLLVLIGMYGPDPADPLVAEQITAWLREKHH